jgi:hypothetical protein
MPALCIDVERKRSFRWNESEAQAKDSQEKSAEFNVAKSKISRSSTARGCFPLLLHKLAKTGQDKCAHLFNLFVDDTRRELRNTPAVLLSVWVASASAL